MSTQPLSAALRSVALTSPVTATPAKPPTAVQVNGGPSNPIWAQPVFAPSRSQTLPVD